MGNLGTGVRCGVHVKIPLFSATDRFDEVLDKMRLQKRGAGGVDCEAEGGLFDISNADRLGFSEVELVNMLIDGVNFLTQMEKKWKPVKTSTKMLTNFNKSKWFLPLNFCCC